MLLKVYSIKDRATGAFNQPFYMTTRAEAIRAFTTMANDPETNIYKYPHDYELYELGEFNNIDGSFMNELIGLGQGAFHQNNKNQSEMDLETHPVDLQAVGDN